MTGSFRIGVSRRQLESVGIEGVVLREFIHFIRVEARDRMNQEQNDILGKNTNIITLEVIGFR